MGLLLSGKKGLIMGVANDRSIAWGIAEACAKEGASLFFTYQNDAIKKRVTPLAESVGSPFLVECDVTSEESIDQAFSEVEKLWGEIDFVVHAVAFSDKNELKGRYSDTTLENFLNTMHISCYSLTSIARRAEKLMVNGGSIITLSYIGADRVMPNYNVMGVAKSALEASVRYLAADFGPQKIRVNTISAGPMKTLAGSAIANARYTYKTSEKTAALVDSVTLEEIGNTAVYLVSDMSSGVTGETHYVDCGFKSMGMLPPARATEDAQKV